MTSHIVNQGETTIGAIADVFNLSFEDTVEALRILLVTEVEGRETPYFIDFSLNSAPTDDDSDLDYQPGDTIEYQPFSYNDPLVYLTYGEAAVSIEMLDQLLKLVDPGSPSGQSLRTVREKIREGTEGTIGAAPPEPRGARDVLDTVWSAFRDGTRLSFDYHSPGELAEHVSRRTVIPCAVVSEAEGYLAALQDEKDLRWFRLDRISRAETGAPVSQTEANRARRTLKKHPEHYPTAGFDVTFTVAPGAAWFAETTPGARTEPNGDSLDITVTSTSIAWVRGCAIKIGTDLLDIAPRDIKRQVVAHAQAMLQAQDA